MSDPEPDPAEAAGIQRRTILIGALGALGIGGAVTAFLLGTELSLEHSSNTVAESASPTPARTPSTSPTTPSPQPSPSVLPPSALRASFKGYSNQVAFRPDGKTVAAKRHGSSDVDLLDAVTGRVVRTFSCPDMAGKSSFSFSSDGKSLATPGDPSSLWEVDTGRLARTFPKSQPHTLVDAVALSPDGRILAIGGIGGIGGLDGSSGALSPTTFVEFRDVASAQTLGTATVSDRESDVYGLSFSPDGSSLVVSGVVPVALVTVPNAAVTAKLGTDSTRGVFSPDGKNIFAAGTPLIQPVIQWNAAGTDPTPLPLRPGVRSVDAMAVSPDGTTLAVVGDVGGLGETVTGAVWLWDIAHRRTTKYIPLGNDNAPHDPLSLIIGGLAFSPDGKTLALTSTHAGAAYDRDAVLQMWDVG